MVMGRKESESCQLDRTPYPCSAVLVTKSDADIVC